MNKTFIESLASGFDKQADVSEIVPLKTSGVKISPLGKNAPVGYHAEHGNRFMNVTPGAILGTALGTVFGTKKGKDNMQKKMQKELINFNNSKPVIEGNYYQQAKHVIDNLSIAFTPFGVIYMLRNENKNVAIDTIETGEMNEDMKNAWKRKDNEYYRSLMVGKMYSEMQMAEQGFARQLLESQKRNNIRVKKAAYGGDYDDDELINYNDCNDLEVLAECLDLRETYQKLDWAEKMAEIVLEDIEKTASEVIIDLKLDRPFDKYAGVISGIKSSLGFGESGESVRSVQKNLSNSNYLKNNLKVGFLPDRVIYTVDDKLVATLPLTKMNEDGYERFEQTDKKYFKDFFKQQLKKGVKEQKVSYVEYDPTTEKLASEVVDTDNMFLSAAVHPVIYFLALNEKYGMKWFDYDPLVLIKAIEDDFGLNGEPINDSALDKVLSIQTVNKSETAYTSPHAFEKVMRAFNSKSIDFLSRENEDLDIDDLVFAIDVLDRVTPFDDIYDNFSEEVFDYMATLLAKRGTKCYSPSYIVGSPLEPKFKESLNKVLLNVVNKISTNDIVNEAIEKRIRVSNTYIHNMSLVVINIIRSLPHNEKENMSDALTQTIIRTKVKPEFRIMIKEQVMKNMALDEVLKLKEHALHAQIEEYGITNVGGNIDG